MQDSAIILYHIYGLLPCCAKKQASEAPAGPAPMINRSVSITPFASMSADKPEPPWASSEFVGDKVDLPVAIASEAAAADVGLLRAACKAGQALGSQTVRHLDGHR